MSNSLISTNTEEVYGENNVRIGYLNKETTLVYQKARYDVDVIDAAAGDPIVPVEKTINLIASTIEHFSMYCDQPITIKLNGSDDAITVEGFFSISGAEITSIILTNSAEVDVNLEMIQGDEAV